MENKIMECSLKQINSSESVIKIVRGSGKVETAIVCNNNINDHGLYLLIEDLIIWWGFVIFIYQNNRRLSKWKIWQITQ